MKQICTTIALFCLLVIAQSVNAQNTVSVGTTAPSGITFGTPVTVSSTNGFSSTNSNPSTFNDFTKGKTDTIVSPSFYYPSQQSTIYFDYNLSTSKAMTAASQVLIITSLGDTLPASTSVSFTGGGVGVDYYITINLAAPINTGTSFKIALLMTISSSDKAITAYTLSSNAQRGTPPAQAPTPLPVNFAGFSTRKVSNGVYLIWNVGTEDNVKGYDVQKSTDGKTFGSIGFVTANQSSSYNFTDSKAVASAYYRIRSVDNDGKYIYSSIISVVGQQSSVVMKAFPMPVQNQLTIQHNTAGNNSRIEVITADGRLIKSVLVAAGTQQNNVDLSSAKAGVYVVRFINDSNIETLKLVKQ